MKPGEELSSEIQEDIGAAINDYLVKYPAHGGSRITPDDLKSKQSIEYKIPWEPVSELQRAVSGETIGNTDTLNPVILKFLNENLAYIQEQLQADAARAHPTGNYLTERPVEGE
jgi:hypothetical protein